MMRSKVFRGISTINFICILFWSLVHDGNYPSFYSMVTLPTCWMYPQCYNRITYKAIQLLTVNPSSIYLYALGMLSFSTYQIKPNLFKLNSVRSGCPIPEPGAHVLNIRAFRIELEFRSVEQRMTIMQIHLIVRLLPINSWGLIVYGLYFLGDNIIAIKCIHHQSLLAVLRLSKHITTCGGSKIIYREHFT